MYPSSRISVEAEVALMVCYTWHQQTPVPKGVVRLRPVATQPPVDHHHPVLRMIAAPIRRHLQDIKYMTYNKNNSSIPNLRRNQY
jgi:hypothetical protein